jgi:hypothetical protein
MTLAAIIASIDVGAWLIANVIATLLLDHISRNRGGRS